jgi:hypothetical protein
MDFVRTTVRPERLSLLGLDAMTADALAASLVRGEVIGGCDYCGRELYGGDADAPIYLSEWSMSLGESLPTTMCPQCAQELDECPIA